MRVFTIHTTQLLLLLFAWPIFYYRIKAWLLIMKGMGKMVNHENVVSDDTVYNVQFNYAL